MTQARDLAAELLRRSGFAQDVGITGRATGSSKQDFITKRKMAWHNTRMNELQAGGMSKADASAKAMEDLKSQNFENDWNNRRGAFDFADPLEEGAFIASMQKGKMFPEVEKGQIPPKDICPLCHSEKLKSLGNMAGDSYAACDDCGFTSSKIDAADGRAVTEEDIAAAHKALGLKNKSTTELSDMIYNHANSKLFTGQVIAQAARAARENNMRMGSYDELNVTSVRAKDAAPMKRFAMIIEINGERQTVHVETNDEEHARATLAKLQPTARVISMQAQDWNNFEDTAKQMKQAEQDDEDFDFTPGKTDKRSIDPDARDALTVSAKPVDTKPVDTKPLMVVGGRARAGTKGT